MRLTRLGILGIALVALAGCAGEDVTSPPLPALAGVRYINAVADTGAIDIRMVDQVEWSATGNALNYRAGIEHQPTEAKARHIRAFSFASTNVAVVQQVIADTTLTFAANTKYTVLLTGSARSKTVKFILITDDSPVPSSTQIAVRTVNASTGAINAYVTTTATDAITGTPTASNLAALSASPYITRNTGSAALRVTAVGSTTATASTAGPTGTVDPVGGAGTFFPSAGVNKGGSAFSAYYFPAGVAGSAQASVTAPSIVWFVDRVPTA